MNEEKTSKAKKLINEFVKNGHWFPIRWLRFSLWC